jgi:hypothetical protein
MKRLILDVILSLSIIFLPWWVSVTLALWFIFIFDYYWEAVLAGATIDTLYGMSQNSLSWLSHLFFLGLLIVLLISFPLKSRLKYYSDKK